MVDSPFLFREFIDENMSQACALSAGSFRLGAIVRRKTEQKHTEDSAGIFQLSQDCVVLAVADGFGGQKSGDQASRIAIQELGALLKGASPERAREAILDAFQQGNRMILEQYPGAATTMVVAEVHQDFVRFFHAGDSTGLLIGGRGKLRFRTLEHNPVGYGAEAGLVSGNEKTLEETGHLVSNYLGSRELRVEVSIGIERRPRDRILVMSDGLSDNMDMNQTLRLKDPLLDCQSLADSAGRYMCEDERGKPDDLSLIILSEGRAPA